MDKDKINHDEKAKKTIERLNDAGSYIVIANFGGNIEIATRGPIESQLLLMKIADLHLTSGITSGFNKG